MAQEFIIRRGDNGFWYGRQGLDQYMRSLGEGKYKIVISKADKRTLAQSDWFHAILPQIKDALRDVGYNDIRTNEEAKDFVKSIFFRKDVSNGIDTVTMIQGTSETSKLDFASKAEDIIQWAKEYLNIDVAPPNHQFEFFE